jgi:hypothetical protein
MDAVKVHRSGVGIAQRRFGRRTATLLYYLRPWHFVHLFRSALMGKRGLLSGPARGRNFFFWRNFSLFLGGP